MPSGKLEVNVLEANGIKDTELFGKADPYAVLSCGETKLRTYTAQDQGSHPVWNQKLSFNINEGTSQLTVRIYNENVLQDDEIGSAIIPLAKVFSDCKVASTSYNVMRPSGRTQGTVKLELSFTPKGSYGKISDISSSGGSHGATYPHVPYGSSDGHGIQSSRYGNAQETVGPYPPQNHSFHPSTPYPPSQYPCPSSMPQNSQGLHPAPYTGYPPPSNMASAYPSSSYPPPPPNMASAYPSSSYPPPPPNMTSACSSTSSSSYPLPPPNMASAYPSSPSYPPPPPNMASAYPSSSSSSYPPPPPYSYNPQQPQAAGSSSYPTENTCFPPSSQFGRNKMKESYQGPHPTPSVSDIPVKKMEELSLGKKPSHNKDSMPFALPAFPSTEYEFSGEKNSKSKPGEGHYPYGYSGAGQNLAGDFPQPVYPAGGVYSEPEKPGKEKKQSSFDCSQTAYPQGPYQPEGSEKPTYGNPREGENPYGTGYPSAAYPASKPYFEAGKASKEKKQDDIDSPSYPHEPFPEGSTYRPAYASSAAGENPYAGYHASYTPVEKSFESGKSGKEKKKDSFDGSHDTYSQQSYPKGSTGNSKDGYSYTGQSPVVAYPPSGYPTAGTPVESGKSGKDKTQGSYDSSSQTGYQQNPYVGGSFHLGPGGYPVSGVQHGTAHDEGKYGTNKEEKKHGSFDYAKHSAYQAPYQGTSFHNVPSQHHALGDQGGKKNDGSKHGKDKQEKKYGSFESHHEVQTGYPPMPYLGGSVHYAPHGYPVSGDHYGGKHGKYKEDKHGSHGKHGKHGKSKGFKHKW